ncbi:MAG: DUF1761 domain-containing protein [Gemmatimonadota bacterium]
MFVLPMPITAILLAAIAYWLLGAAWYSLLFGKLWAADQESRGLRLTKPAGAQLVTRLVLTFLGTFLAATAVAWVLQCFSVNNAAVATRLSLVLGLGIAAATLLIGPTWEGKPLRLFLIDALYHLVGIWLCAMVLLQWRR